MNQILSATVSFNGWPVKVEGGKIFVRTFGTTIANKSMHWSWQEIKEKDLKKDCADYLRDKGLI